MTTTRGIKAVMPMLDRAVWTKTCSKWPQDPYACVLPRAMTTAVAITIRPGGPAKKLQKLQKLPTVRYASTQSAYALQKTPLYDFHVKHGAKMVPFAGFSMPVQYGDLAISESHLWTREKASLFDVSHMVQYEVSGPGAAGFLSRITPTAIDALQPYHSTLSCFLHRPTGGIVDDTVITRLGADKFYFVANAACRDKDFRYFQTELKQWTEAEKQPSVEIVQLSTRGLIALQGPLSAAILASCLTQNESTDLASLYFGQCTYLTIRLPSGKDSDPVLASRGGYTGEDGFELSTSTPEQTVIVTEAILAAGGSDRLRLAGLGARDSLRLEAGMCLYGHDLDDSTTPVEGGLSWVISKDRRVRSSNAGPFNGQDVILRQLKPKKEGGGVTRRRVGLVVSSAPAREGARVVDSEGNDVGSITSGCPSPSLKRNIAMGYVRDGLHKAGTELGVIVRGKTRSATVTKMPFLPTNFHRPPTGKD